MPEVHGRVTRALASVPLCKNQVGVKKTRMQVNLSDSIGFIAAACTTLSFIPQLLKIRKQGGRDLSYAMLCVYLIGLALWLVYGLLLHAAAVIAANAASMVLVAASIMMKAITDPGRARG